MPSDEAPKVFGREMELTEKNRFTTHWQLMAGHVRLGLSHHYEAGYVEWSAACRPQETDTVESGIAQIEARCIDLVTGLGPLVGWAPKGGADAG